MTWQLMENNIPPEDLNNLADFIRGNPILTNGNKVKEFEAKWSEWLGVKYSVYVNSGGTANLLTLMVLREKLIEEGVDENDLGEVIVSSVNWITDISSIMLCGFKPVFVDVSLKNVSMDHDDIKNKITSNTKAVLLTHLMGFNAYTDDLKELCSANNIMLIEDVCESHGIEYKNRKGGSLGDVSNFSFYYGHHITTVEGGMVCTNDHKIYQMARMMRSHGLVRESTDEYFKSDMYELNAEPSPEFVFAYPGFNFRGTEIGGFLGIIQIDHLDKNIQVRRRNFKLFLELLDSDKFITDYDLEGNSNFGLIIILKEKDDVLIEKLVNKLTNLKIAFRRGIAGGGNQLRQPYLRRKNYGNAEDFANADHIHYYGLYIGNHQYITEDNIKDICEVLNNA